MTTLTIDGPTFYSQGDEKSFFHWLQTIPAVARVVGVGRQLDVHLASDEIDDDSLRELIALTFRHRIDMRPLRVLVSKRNARWFRDKPEMFWHALIFGEAADRSPARKQRQAVA